MLISYLPPKRMPSDRKDSPQIGLPEEGSGELGLMVAGYLLALFAGIVLLGTLTPTSPVMSVVTTDTVRTN